MKHFLFIEKDFITPIEEIIIVKLVNVLCRINYSYFVVQINSFEESVSFYH